MELKWEDLLLLKIDLNINYLSWSADAFMIIILKFHYIGVEWGDTIPVWQMGKYWNSLQ